MSGLSAARDSRCLASNHMSCLGPFSLSLHPKPGILKPSAKQKLNYPRPSSYPLLGPKYLLLGTIYPQLRVQRGSWTSKPRALNANSEVPDKAEAYPNVDPWLINPLHFIGIIIGILIFWPLKVGGLLIMGLHYTKPDLSFSAKLSM